MTRTIKRILIIPLLAFSAGISEISAQEIIEIEPLFEYPSAPEELSTLEDKSNYLVEHFWDSFNFKSKNTVDQNALNDAFRVYSVPLRWAHRDKSVAAVDKLIQSISKNPTLLMQFTKAAEETIYSPRAEVWVDDVYLKFLNAIVKNKKVPQSRREKYERQLKVLTNCHTGNSAPEFKFENVNGDNATYFPMSTPTIIIFGNPRNTDWRLNRLRLEANAALTEAINKGKVNVLFIIPRKMDNWKSDVTGYSSKWTVGCGENLKDIYDLRAEPSIYTIGADGKIIFKNTPVETAVEKVLEIIKSPVSTQQ